VSSKTFTLYDQYGIAQNFTLRTGERSDDVVVEMQAVEDVDAIIDDNKRAQNSGKQTLGKGTQTSMYKLGQLSHLQVYNLMQQGVFQDDNKLRGWFNDLDNYLWRTVSKKRKGGTRAVQSLQNP